MTCGKDDSTASSASLPFDCFRHHLQAGFPLDHQPKAVAHQRVIVGKDNANLTHACSSCGFVYGRQRQNHGDQGAAPLFGAHFEIPSELSDPFLDSEKPESFLPLNIEAFTVVLNGQNDPVVLLPATILAVSAPAWRLILLSASCTIR